MKRKVFDSTEGQTGSIGVRAGVGWRGVVVCGTEKDDVVHGVFADWPQAIAIAKYILVNAPKPKRGKKR